MDRLRSLCNRFCGASCLELSDKHTMGWSGVCRHRTSLGRRRDLETEKAKRKDWRVAHMRTGYRLVALAAVAVALIAAVIAGLALAGNTALIPLAIGTLFSSTLLIFVALILQRRHARTSRS